jgi:hypothetical protein
MNTNEVAILAVPTVDLDALKEKHGEIYKVAVADEVVKHDPYMVPSTDEEELDNAVVVYIRKPTSKEINFAMSKMPQMIEAGKVILKTCFVAGDRRVLDDPSMFTAGALSCIELLEIRQSQLKKL